MTPPEKPYLLDQPAYFLTFVAVVTLALVALDGIMQRLIGGAKKESSARSILEAGRLFAVFSVSAAVVTQCVHGEDLKSDLMWVSVFGVGAVMLMDISGRIGIGLLMRSRLAQEIEEGNVAAGIAGGAHYGATGIIMSRCIGGDDLRSLGIALVFFVIAQITLHLFVTLFRAVTVYDDSEEIAGENAAAAVSYGGVTVALALIIAHAAEGDFESWSVSLRGYLYSVLFAVALYPVRQIVVQSMILRSGLALRRGRLDKAIAQERNIALAALEATAYLATAFLITRIR